MHGRVCIFSFLKYGVFASLLFFIFGFVSQVYGATYYSRNGGGNWNTAATWSTTSHSGSAAATPPGSSDTVMIGDNDIVTMDVSVSNNASVTVNSSGTLNCGLNTLNGTGSFTLNSSGTLGIGQSGGIAASGSTGNIQVSGTRIFSTGANYSYNVDTGSQSTGSGLPSTVNALTVDNTNGVTLTASVTVNGTLTLTAGTLAVGSNTLTIGSTSSVSSGTLSSASNGTIDYSQSSGSHSVLAITYGNLIISDAATRTLAGNTSVQGNLTVSGGTLDLSSYTANRSSAGGTITVSNGATLEIGSTNGFPSNYSTHTLGATSTVEYGGSNQSVSAESYGHLTFSGSGTKTFASGTTYIAGDFTVSAGTANATTNSTTINYNGSGAQTVAGITYYNLTINKSSRSGAELGGSTTVNNTLSITAGWLTQGNAYSLTAGTISISADTTLHNQGTGDLTVGVGGVSNSGTIDFKSSGGSCGVTDAIQILSSQNGTQRSWTGSGTFKMVDLYVKDQGSSASIHCYSCTSGGNNAANWTIDSSCTGAPTVVKLASFTARQCADHVQLAWVTKTEIDNLGFNLFRSANNGAYTQLNQNLIPGLISSYIGRAYTYDDTNVIPGAPLCYLLEDIDLKGIRTSHGPACVYLPSTGQAGEVTPTQQETGTGSTAASHVEGTTGTTVQQTTNAVTAEQYSHVRTASVTAVALRSLAAHTDGSGVLITWTTGREHDNLGFHVYRDEGGHRTRLTKEPVAGSALRAGTAQLAAGHAYRFFDTDVGNAYYVEDIDLSGIRTLHGPVSPVRTEQPLLRKHLPFLSEITGEKGSADHALRVRLGMGRQGRAHTGHFGRPFPAEAMSPQETQRALAGSQAVKLFVRDEGWYRVPLAELTALGITAGNPRFLQLFVDGKEEPILVHDSAIEFYGRGIDTPYTDTRVYWLVQGSRPGKRILPPSSPPPLRGRGSVTQASFPYTVTLKERTIYFAALQNGDAENFFGSVITTEPIEKELTVTKRANGGALLDVVLQGVTLQAHEVSISVNGHAVGSVSFSGQNKGKGSFTIPQTGLKEGTNSIRFTGSGELDVTMLDTLKFTYPRTYTVEKDKLLFTAQGGRQVALRGFTTNRVQVMDSTDPTKVQEVTGEGRPDGTGYALKIGIPGSGERTLIAVTEKGVSHPAAMVPNEPSAWYRYAGADLVLVSHHDFMGSVTPLKSLREQEGLSVAIVDIEAIYDEFSFGMKTPYALKAFMTRARSWRRPPRYLLLVGDASMDPKNYLGLGSFDFVPTKLVDATYLETASDDWFVDGTNDLIPDIPIGRLPVRTEEEAVRVVAKLTGYAATEQGESALFVADETSTEDVFDFTGASDGVRGLMPEGITTHAFSRGDRDDGELKAEFMRAFNQGALLVNYVGHGSTELWRGDILTASDAETLTNGTKLPFVVAMTCLNGLFQDVHAESLAEALMLAPQGGAIAVWASTGLTAPDAQAPMNRELIRLLFGGAQGQHLTIGQAVREAKRATSDPDVRKTWVLLGDPATRVK
jgi:hypothetical protein